MVFLFVREQIENQIRALREARGLTQEQLAKLAGTTSSTISKLERGDMKLTTDYMESLSQALGCRSIDLLVAELPPSATKIDPEIVRYALYITDETKPDDPDDNPVIRAERFSHIYDLLIDVRTERGTIDNNTIDTVIRAFRIRRPPRMP